MSATLVRDTNTTVLDMLGLIPEDLDGTCAQLVVDYEYSVDENCHWPVLACGALIDARLALDPMPPVTPAWASGYDAEIPF